MKIAIVSDFHFGFPKFYEDSFSQGREAFERCVGLADIVIIAGDVFDAKVPRPEVLDSVMEIFEVGKRKNWKIRGKNREIPIVAIHGTHERRAKEYKNPIQLLARSGFLTDISDRCVEFEKEGEKVAIHGFGGVPDEFVESAIKEKNFLPVRDAFNIFVFHQTIPDFLPFVRGLSLKDLPAGFDLYVCGHLHKITVEKVGGRLLIIPGSTVITQLRKEENDKKGFFLFDTKSEEYEFVPISCRPFVYKELNFASANSNEIKEGCRKSVEDTLKEHNNMPIIRIVLSGEVKEGLKKENIEFRDILAEYKGKAFLEIENTLNTKGLKESIEEFRALFAEKKSVKEVGVEILKQKVKFENVDKIFEMLSEEKGIEELLNLIKSKKWIL